jgi:hypothetical protein
VLPKYRTAVVLDRSNIRTGFFIRTPPSHSDRSFRLFIDCGFGQHALYHWVKNENVKAPEGAKEI